MAYKLPNPERVRSERNRELKKLRTKPDEPDRVERAAALAVVFHEERDINHVMELAQLVLDLTEDGVEVLTGAYLDEVTGVEDRMERLAMLANVGRWITHDGLEQAANGQGIEEAAAWVDAMTDEIDRAERLTVVERRFDAEVRQAVQERLG